MCDNVPIGSAFAVRCPQQNKLITAGHVVYDYDNGQPIVGKLSVSLQVEKNRLGQIINVRSNKTYNVKVDVNGLDCDNDWAVLSLVSKRRIFSIDDSIPICGIDEIPSVKYEPQFKLYHCPAEQYDLIRVVSVTPSPWMKTQAIVKTSGLMFFPFGFSKGSSGGVYVDREGRAVAVHLESISSAMTLEEAKSISGSARSTDEKSLEEAINSSAHSHTSISRCLIISCFPVLLNNLT
jgi:hypothetical protein